MANFYNLFKFLEDKKGKKIPFKTKLLYAPEALTKDDLYVEGDLDFYNVTKEYILPDNLTITGYVILENPSTTSLPDNLKVGSFLDIRNTEINSIPNNLRIDETFYITTTPLAKKYTRREIIEMIEDKGGYVKGDID